MGSKEYNKARRQRLTEQGLCNKCGKTEAEEGKTKCETCLKYYVDYNRKHFDTIGPKQKLYRKKVRAGVIEKYGGECECCNEDTIEFLAIDHKNQDGHQERRELYGSNSGSSYSWYLKLQREDVREDLRVLCHNCNIAISMYGRCPHED
jgi:hypothetical protein